MLPLLIPLFTSLASNGLGLLSSAIQAKGKEVIEEKLGIKIPDDPEKLTPEIIEKLKIAEMEHEEVLIELSIKKAEQTIEQDKVDNDNTDSARDMNKSIQMSSQASPISKVAAYYLDFIIVISTLLVAGLVIFVTIPAGNKELAFTILGSLMALCGTVVNFHRGTSASSHVKDLTIQNQSNRIGDK